MVNQAAQVLTGDIHFQGPGNIGVTKDHPRIWHAFNHQTLVDNLVFQNDVLAVYLRLDSTEHLNIQAGGRNDDVSIQVLTRLQLNTGLGETLNMIGRNRRPARFHCFEQVAIFYHTQTLIPGIIVWREMTHVGLVIHLTFDNAQEQAAHSFRAFAGALIQKPGNRDVASPGQPISSSGGQWLLQGECHFVR